MSAERIVLYRRLLNDAGAPKGFRVYRTSIAFVAYTSGMVVHGSGKSYVRGSRSKYDSDLIEGDLEVAAAGMRRFVGLRHIEGDWYLELTVH